MTNVSIKQLAELVRTTPERLLQQLNEAGVSVTTIDQTINEEEKRKLLMHLQKTHGSTETQRSKITLQRKKVSVVKAGKKSVQVEVRSRRTYAKPETTQPAAVDTATVATEEIPQDISAEIPKEISKEIPKEISVEPEISATVPESPPSESTSEAVPKPIIKEEPEKREAPGQKLARKKEKTRGRGRGERSEETWDQTELHMVPRGIDNRRKKPSTKPAARVQATASTKLEQSFSKPVAPMVTEVAIPESITVADLARKMSIKAAELIKAMISMGVMATINQRIDQETAAILVQELGHKPKLLKADTLEESVLSPIDIPEADLVPRAPVVTIMGHVDHGKTSLLDYIRRTKVTSTEAGGITQHIGAYHVETKKGMVTFLDTPGHEAFTAMRARGVKCTDIVVLVVAADDGVMPQTIEAIQHARAAKVAMVVAINKIDKPEADPERIKTELSKYGVVADDWGGDVMFQNISARTGAGVDELLDRILLQADVLELKAPNQGAAVGVVIESRLDKGRGPVATILVMRGELRLGDILLVGREYGRIRAMLGDDGKPKKQAGPSMPVEVQGLSGTPSAGDEAYVVSDERKAREITQFRQGKYRETRIAKKQTAQLSSIFDQHREGQTNSLNVVLKTDVQGSLEAISDALLKLSTDEVKVNIVASSVGGITESDVNLAIASNAIVIGFNVRANQTTRAVVEREGVDLRYYSIIYDLIDEVKKALSGLLAPQFEEKMVGLAEVREVFRSSKVGAIAGCLVVEGNVRRNLPIRILRDNVVIYQGEIESLRRYKDDVREVQSGMECGIGVKNYNDIKVGDQIEVFEKVKIERKL